MSAAQATKLAAYWDWTTRTEVPNTRIVVCAPGRFDPANEVEHAIWYGDKVRMALFRGAWLTLPFLAPIADGAHIIAALHVRTQVDLVRLSDLLAVKAVRRALVVSPEEAIDLDPLVCEEHGEAEIVNGDDGVTPFCSECPGGEEATEMGSASYLDDIDIVLIVGFDKPLHPDWVRGVVAQCRAAGVPCVFLGWGLWLPEGQIVPNSDERDLVRMFFDRSCKHQAGSEPIETRGHRFIRMPAARNGALLDGDPVEDVPTWIESVE